MAQSNELLMILQLTDHRHISNWGGCIRVFMDVAIHVEDEYITEEIILDILSESNSHKIDIAASIRIQKVLRDMGYMALNTHGDPGKTLGEWMQKICPTLDDILDELDKFGAIKNGINIKG